MENIKIVPMTFPADKQQISNWKTLYENTDGWENIQKFILEDNTYINLGEVIETNHEIFPIGYDEKKLAFVAKTQKGEIVAWVLIDAFDLNTADPEMFLQYIVINPAFQHQGYGTKIASEFFLTPEKYIGIKPSEIFAYIDIKNTNSMQLFSKFNFNLMPITNQHYFRASTKEPKLVLNTNPATYGE